MAMVKLFFITLLLLTPKPTYQTSKMCFAIKAQGKGNGKG